MTNLQIAISDLSAVRVARAYYAYQSRDEGRPQWYGVTSDDLRDYGARLRRDQPDAYSLWCADTTADRLGVCDEYDPIPTLRRRASRTE